jgi:hypothetical protein
MADLIDEIEGGVSIALLLVIVIAVVLVYGWAKNFLGGFGLRQPTKEEAQAEAKTLNQQAGVTLAPGFTPAVDSVGRIATPMDLVVDQDLVDMDLANIAANYTPADDPGLGSSIAAMWNQWRGQ